MTLVFSFSYLRQLFRNLFHKQGFTYDYVFDWNMLKFGGPRQDSDQNPHAGGGGGPGAAAGGAVAGGNAGNPGATPGQTPGNGNGEKERKRHTRGNGGNGNNVGLPMDMSLSQQQMAPPELPFATVNPPVVRIRGLQ